MLINFIEAIKKPYIVARLILQNRVNNSEKTKKVGLTYQVAVINFVGLFAIVYYIADTCRYV